MSTPYDNLFRLDGRVAAVVGAASGIGAAGAAALAAHGAHVICADVNAEGARAIADGIRASGNAAESARVDILDRGDPKAFIDAVVRDHGRLDVLVITPGMNYRKPTLEYTEEEFDRVIDLNLRGAFRLMQAGGVIMKAQQRGSMILFSSIRAVTVEPGQVVYAATKAAIVQMARTLAVELGRDGVRVNAIAPGVVETPLTRPVAQRPDWYRAYAEKSAFERWATPDEIAGPIVFLASDAASYVTGSLLFVDGGWTAIDGRFRPM